jgi:heme/copper-type cytochrome/quinol oxidase subunit 2
LASDPDLFRRVLTAQVKEASPVFAGCLALSGPTRARLSQDSREKPGGEAQVIEVTARKYEFAPAEIHVTKGNRVRLRVHSTDEAHGIRLNLYPEGSKDKSSPGLAFDNPQRERQGSKGQDQVLDFVAQQAGTYEFKCARVCGMHHGRMRRD